MKKIKERSSKRQLAINMLSSTIVFGLNMCVTFFLTPFIVSKLGTAAYGFIGLSSNIIGYTSLLTIAINSMAGRFITIKVHERKIEEANIYMSSVFYTNLVFGGFILLIVLFGSAFLQYFIKIPSELISDVKLLFLMLGISSVLGLMTGVISVGAFIRNRLEITNIRNVIGSLIRVSLLLLLFSLFIPKLWYFGVTALIMNIYSISSNYYFYRLLTPELQIKRKYFDFKKLREIATSGMWNILNKVGEILSSGLNLLLANLFVAPKAMGLLSIANSIPVIVLSFFGMISGNFAPELTKIYALRDYETLKKEIFKAIRITGFLSNIPLAIVFVYCDIFFASWLPSENAELLFTLTRLCSFALIFSLPQQPLWQVFTITNKVRISSINFLSFAILIFSTVLVCMYLIDDPTMRLYCIAGIRTSYGVIQVLTFLPLYSAKCLDYPKTTFYPYIVKNFITVLLLIFISTQFKKLLNYDWIGFFEGSTFTLIVGIFVNSFLVLTKKDRLFILQKLKIIKS